MDSLYDNYIDINAHYNGSYILYYKLTEEFSKYEKISQLKMVKVIIDIITLIKEGVLDVINCVCMLKSFDID